MVVTCRWRAPTAQQELLPFPHGGLRVGLPNGEVVIKVRLSRDGKLVLIFMEASINASNGKIYWVALPSFAPL